MTRLTEMSVWHPVEPPMPPIAREAYLQQRLLNRLYDIVVIAGAIRGRPKWTMRHADE